MSRLNPACGFNSDARCNDSVSILNPDSDDRRVNVSHVLTAVCRVISINIIFLQRSVIRSIKELNLVCCFQNGDM